MTLIHYLQLASVKDLKRVLKSDKEYLYGDVSVFNVGTVVNLRVSDRYKPINQNTWNGYDFVFENDSTTKGYIEEVLKEKLQLSVMFKGWDCKVEFAKYGNGRTAIQLIDAEDGSPVAKATVNIPEVILADDEIIIKHWSENEGMPKALINAGIISEPIRFTHSGHVSNIPICKLLKTSL